MARNARPGQKIGAVFCIVLGVICIVLGTWGPYKDVTTNRRLPVSWGGVVACAVGVLLLVLGPSRRDP